MTALEVFLYFVLVPLGALAGIRYLHALKEEAESRAVSEDMRLAKEQEGARVGMIESSLNLHDSSKSTERKDLEDEIDGLTRPN